MSGLGLRNFKTYLLFFDHIWVLTPFMQWGKHRQAVQEWHNKLRYFSVAGCSQLCVCAFAEAYVFECCVVPVVLFMTKRGFLVVVSFPVNRVGTCRMWGLEAWVLLSFLRCSERRGSVNIFELAPTPHSQKYFLCNFAGCRCGSLMVLLNLGLICRGYIFWFQL